MHLLLILEPDHVIAVSGRHMALHERWPADDPPRIAGEKISDLSDDQVSALLSHLQYWGAEPRRSRGGPGIVLDM